MIDDDKVIETLDDLEQFIMLVESGAMGLEHVAGIALATHNTNSKPFIAVLDEQHQLLLGRWVSQYVYENGKDLVRYGSQKKH